VLFDTRPKQPLLRSVGLLKSVPEVVVKVISPGSNTLEAIRLHFEELRTGRTVRWRWTSSATRS
jgi:hypothetical protein